VAAVMLCGLLSKGSSTVLAGRPLQLLQQAAASHNVIAQYTLARYYSSDGHDYVEAARLYRAAASRNYVPAVFELAGSYHTGKGVEKNRREALM
jgi:TPR repeat protein